MLREMLLTVKIKSDIISKTIAEARDRIVTVTMLAKATVIVKGDFAEGEYPGRYSAWVQS